MNVKDQIEPSGEEAKAEAESRPANAEKPQEEGSFLVFLLKLLAVVLIFRSFIFSPFSIPSESMLPKLMNGDYLLAAKWPYGFSKYSLPLEPDLFDGRIFACQPERGDVVIFKHPIDGVDYIKRVIALPGDTIGLRDGHVILNGKVLEKEKIGDFILPVSANTRCAWGAVQERGESGGDVCRYTRFRETLPGGDSYEVLDFGSGPADFYGPVIVPEDMLFLMGDNRDNSQDSRFAAQPGGAIGMVPQDLLVGKAVIVMWSTDGGANWFLPWTWFTAARWGRIGETL